MKCTSVFILLSALFFFTMQPAIANDAEMTSDQYRDAEWRRIWSDQDYWRYNSPGYFKWRHRWVEYGRKNKRMNPEDHWKVVITYDPSDEPFNPYRHYRPFDWQYYKPGRYLPLKVHPITQIHHLDDYMNEP